MGVLLRGRGGDFTLNNRGWALVLKLAYDYGWRPAGTLPPSDWAKLRPPGAGEWNGVDYFTCRGQRISSLDASRLAGALAKAMDDLPHHDPLEHEFARAVDAPGFPRLHVLPTDRLPNAFEQLGGENREGLQRLVDLCRAGEVAIW